MKNALLVARIGPTRDGIQALLDSMKDVELVAVTNNFEAALAYSSENCPKLVVLIIHHLTIDLKVSEVLTSRVAASQDKQM